jgi:hypothetical protein
MWADGVVNEKRVTVRKNRGMIVGLMNLLVLPGMAICASQSN